MKDYDRAVADYHEAIRLNPNHGIARNNLVNLANQLIPPILERANASRDRNDYDAAIAQYREALKINPNHANARNNFKTLWDKRIAENPQIYPAPFTGWWSYHIPAIVEEARTETYYKTESYTVEGPSWRSDTNGSTYHPGTSKTISRQVAHTRNVPKKTILPAVTIIYEFKDTNYTTNSNGEFKSGTFFYKANKIELDDGTILVLENNAIKTGYLELVKMKPAEVKIYEDLRRLK